MPFKSKAQMRLFYAAANKSNNIKGLDKETAQKFIKDSKHQTSKGLPERFNKLKNKMRKK